MTELLQQAVEALRNLSPDRQDDLARMVLQVVGEELPALPLSAEDEASFDESLAQAERGEFATDVEVRAIWAKHGL
jgi:predicted transcriptional regulator